MMKMNCVPLTPSRRTRLIVHKLLRYAEAGGMRPKDCGITYEAIDNCLMAVGDDPDAALGGLIDEIRTVIHGEAWNSETDEIS